MQLTKNICHDTASVDQVIDSWFTGKPSVSDEEIEAVVFETVEDESEEPSRDQTGSGSGSSEIR